MSDSESDEFDLIGYAQRELKLCNENPKLVKKYLKILKIFSDLQLTSREEKEFIDKLLLLLKRSPLSPLTDDPKEWDYQSRAMWGILEGMWLNNRNYNACSEDGGKTYILFTDASVKSKPNDELPIYNSVHHSPDRTLIINEKAKN